MNGSRNWNYPVVAVVGLCSKGKTTILNMLAGTKFAATKVQGTKGLRFKLLNADGKMKLVLLDTPGMFAPVPFPKSKFFVKVLAFFLYFASLISCTFYGMTNV